MTVESRQERVFQGLHQNRSVDDQLDTENCQTWVEQGLDMSENNYVTKFDEIMSKMEPKEHISSTDDRNTDSGISSGTADSDADSVDEKFDDITTQIAKIDGLLLKRNDENQKTKESLQLLDKNEHQKASEEKAKNLGSETVDTSSKSRVSFSGSWATDKAEDITWASSMEPKRYPIVVFNPAALSQPSYTPVGSRYHLTFKMVQAEAKICSQILQAHGFQEVTSSNQDFNIMWTGSHPNPHISKSMLPHQRVNHFPRSYELTRKDRMYKNIERLQISKGPKHFNFIPKTFTIPNEYSEFAAAHHRTRGKAGFRYLQYCNHYLIFGSVRNKKRFTSPILMIDTT